MQQIVPVILSGGSGTRLWPVSRESFPKQLWPLISDRSLIQETALRATGAGFAAPIVVCNHEHRFLIAEQLRLAGIEGARIVLEPVGRNSAPAIAAAALLQAETDPDAVLWMMAADAAGEDRFDSLLGTLCVINVLEGNRPDVAPPDPWLTRWEGWVLGQTDLPALPQDG